MCNYNTNAHKHYEYCLKKYIKSSKIAILIKIQVYDFRVNSKI